MSTGLQDRRSEVAPDCLMKCCGVQIMSCDGDRFGVKAVMGASSHVVEMCVITLIQS